MRSLPFAILGAAVLFGACQRSGDWNLVAEQLRKEVQPGDVIVLVPKRESARLRAFPGLQARASDDPTGDGTLRGAARAWIVHENAAAGAMPMRLGAPVKTLTEGELTAELYDLAPVAKPPAWDFIERFAAADISGGDAQLGFAAPNTAAGAVRCIQLSPGATARFPLVNGGAKIEGRMTGDPGAKLLVRVDDVVKATYGARAKADWAKVDVALPEGEPVLAVAFSAEGGSICVAATVPAR